MIKDIVANLSVGTSRDVATDFAVSVATTFDAHLTGVAFLYEPLVPVTDRYGFPSEVIQSQRVENEKGAQAAVTNFGKVVRRAAISAESRMLDVPVTSAPSVFANIARRFDLAITGQPEPHKPALERLIVEAADASADFLAMGGYGHSRLREFVLGGVTRGILTSMTVPTLMSH